MIDGIIHFFEPHPSLIVSGSAILTTLGIWRQQIIDYIKELF